jgi:hypothetical protein
VGDLNSQDPGDPCGTGAGGSPVENRCPACGRVRDPADRMPVRMMWRCRFSLLPHRTIEDLDPFCEADAARYWRESKAWNPGPWESATRLAALGAIAPGVALVTLLLTALELSPIARPLLDRHPAVETGAFVLSLLISILAAGAIGIIIRGVAVRGIIRRRIEADTCPRCAYSLVGLPSHTRLVVCPECGADVPYGPGPLSP